MYQTINKKRYFTHLVQPIDDEIFEEQDRTAFRFGRWVRAVAYTGKENKIPFESAHLDLRNRGFGLAVEIKNIIGEDNLENYQKQIWNLFKPFFENNLQDNSRDSQNYLNDELGEDFETAEGRLLFRNHRIRERDGSLTFMKKEIARRQDCLFCEVCHFSFIEAYLEDYIECHHIVPISQGERISKIEDLILVCSIVTVCFTEK